MEPAGIARVGWRLGPLSPGHAQDRLSVVVGPVPSGGWDAVERAWCTPHQRDFSWPERLLRRVEDEVTAEDPGDLPPTPHVDQVRT